MRVELDLYSGRPNPAWTLSPGEEAEFRRRFASLADVAGASLDDRLGYRGLIVRAESSDVAIPLREAVVSAGAVRLTGIDGATSWRRDDGRSLERWLLEVARGHLDAPLVDLGLADLGREIPATRP